MRDRGWSKKGHCNTNYGKTAKVLVLLRRYSVLKDVVLHGIKIRPLAQTNLQSFVLIFRLAISIPYNDRVCETFYLINDLKGPRQV